MNGTVELLVCQVDVPKTRSAVDRNRHLAALKNRVDVQLSQRHADLVVLPELVSIEYANEAFECLSDLSEPSDGESFQIWRDLSQKYQCTIAYSFALATKNNRVQIASAVVKPNGELAGVYAKQYLAQFGASSEKLYFEAGSDLLVFELDGFRFALIVCADIRFPELSRTLTVDHNADVILHQGAYARDSTFCSWHNFAITRALENQIYLVSVNRAGKEYGHSIVVPPWVDQYNAPKQLHQHDEHFVYISVDKSVIERVRKEYPFLADRKCHI